MQELDKNRQLEIGVIQQNVRSLISVLRPVDGRDEIAAGTLDLPKSLAGTSVIIFVATSIAQGFLQGLGARIFQSLFGGSSTIDLRKLMEEVIASLRHLLREFAIEQEIENSRNALEKLYLLLAEHLTNPPPQGPRDRIEFANQRVLDLTTALEKLGILGFHNYLSANGCYLLVLEERARIDGPAEMKNACRRLRRGIEHAEKVLLDWRHWSDSRLSTRNSGWDRHGEPTTLQITMNGQLYSAAGVRGWYRVNDLNDDAKFIEEYKLAKDLLWAGIRKDWDLDAAVNVLEKWRELELQWTSLGYCNERVP